MLKRLLHFFQVHILRQEIFLKEISWSLRKQHIDESVMQSREKGTSDQLYCDCQVIVSLTTYGNRLYSVYLTIESLLNQTLKPNMVILWLAEELRGVRLPILLQMQVDRGLSIDYYKDIRSYKKLIPSLKKYPNDIIITADDDLIYEIDMVEKLFNAYKINPKLIYFNRGHRIRLKKDGKPDKYLKWYWRVLDYKISALNFPTTGGGTLFPPHCFNNEVFNEQVFMDICTYADDIWFKAMALYNGTKCRKVYTHNNGGEDYIENPHVQDNALSSYNVKANDIQIKAVFDRYNLYKFLSHDT